MTVTVKATVKVRTVDVRSGLRAVYPHRNKVKTGDASAENRIRLVFSASWLFILASNNGNTAAVAKCRIIEDTRGALGVLEPDDGPMIVDLHPTEAPLLLQTFKAGQKESDIDQVLAFDIDLDPAERMLDVTDVGGLFEGRSVRFPLEDPAESFPNVLARVGEAAAAAAGDRAGNRKLVQDGAIIALFATASKAYGQPVQIEPVGVGNERGFLVACGPDFMAVVSSQHDDDGQSKRRDADRLAWLELLPAKLRAV